jgi:uncharacterized protein (TIGR03067 family)
MKKLLPVIAVILAAITVYVIIVASSDNVDGLTGDPWVMVAIEKDGKKIALTKKEQLRLHFTKSKATWIVAGRDGDVGIDGPFRIDPNKRPKHIDVLQPPHPGQDDELVEGIYDVKDDTLFICIGERRPAEFSAVRGEPQIIWIFKR